MGASQYGSCSLDLPPWWNTPTVQRRIETDADRVPPAPPAVASPLSLPWYSCTRRQSCGEPLSCQQSWRQLCSSAATDYPPFTHPPPEVEELLTAAAADPARMVQPTGQTIDQTEAVELAKAFLTTFGSHFQDQIDRQHGDHVDLAALTPTQVTFAESSFTPPARPVPVHVRNALGPYYIIEFSQAGVPAVSLGLAAWAVDLGRAGGKLLLPKHSGNEFRIHGLPRDGRWNTLSKADVIHRVETETGRVVIGEPRFITRGPRWVPQLGNWLVDLDEPITVKGTDGSGPRVTRRLALTVERQLALPLPTGQQRADVDFGNNRFSVSRSADAPTDVLPITIERRR